MLVANSVVSWSVFNVNAFMCSTVETLVQSQYTLRTWKYWSFVSQEWFQPIIVSTRYQNGFMISILEKVINHRISGFMFSSDRFSDTSPVYWGELLEDKNSISLPRAPVRMWICALKHSKTSWNISNQLFFLETFQINCFLESWFPGPFSKRLSWCSHGLLNIFLNLQLYDFDFVNLCLVNSNSIHAQFSGDRTALKRGAWQWKTMKTILPCVAVGIYSVWHASIYARQPPKVGMGSDTCQSVRACLWLSIHPSMRYVVRMIH